MIMTIDKKMKILFIWPNKDAPFYRPINIALLSALLKRDGHDTKCFDTTFFDFGFSTISEITTTARIHKPVDLSPYNLGKKSADNIEKIFLDFLKDYNPDVVAVSVLSGEVKIGKYLCDIVKKWNKNKIVIWGGKGALVDPEEILSFDSVDYICMGEGLIALPEFIRALANNLPVEKIKNIWYKKDSLIIKNELYPPYDDFDNLPYLDWSIFDDRLSYKPYEGKVYRGGDYMITMGCPNNCSYCLNDYYHKLYGCIKLQRYSPKRAIAELKYLTDKYKVEFYKFHDEDFLLKPTEYFNKLAELYAKEVNIPFTCMTNSKFVTEEKVELLKKMNCVSVSLGVETGNQKLRKEVLLRKDTREDVVRAFQLLKRAGIRNLAFNMMALPFETRETYMETVELNREADVQVPCIGFFFPLKKTELREVSIKNGFYNPEKEKVYDESKPALEFKNLSEEELIALRDRFVLYVKLPKQFWPFIERSEKRDAAGLALTDKLYQIYNECVFNNDGWYNADKTNQYIDELKAMNF